MSKPKSSILFPLILFLIIAYALVIYTLLNFLSSEEKAVYQYAILIVISPIVLGVTAKVLLDYKIVKMGKGKITVRYPFRFKSLAYKVAQIDHWKETVVRSGKNIFKELAITFSDKTQVKLTKQENSGYDEIYSYLKKKCSRKMGN